MKTAALLTFLFIFTFQFIAHTQSNILIESNLQWQGWQRGYLVHQPVPITGNRPVPLLVVLHGGGGRAAGISKTLGGRFEELADRDGFIVAYPDAINNNWADGRTSYLKPGQEDIDDVEFLEKMVKTLINQYPIDRDRIFITGISNGGWMSARMLCEKSDLFRGGAMVAATISEDYFPHCNPTEAVGVLVINGTKDPILPYAGGNTFVFGKFETEGKIVGTQAFIDFWVQKNQCNTEMGSELLPNKRWFDGTTVQVDTYSGCRQGSKVVLYKIEGGGHTWPGTKQYLPASIIGKTSREINGCDVIWNFFKSLL